MTPAGDLQDYNGKFITGFEKDAKHNGNFHVFVAEVNGQTKYVFPVYGAGLWGAIWGYVALNDDKDTVYGTYFSHASETPGLGAEIATERKGSPQRGEERQRQRQCQLGGWRFRWYHDLQRCRCHAEGLPEQL